jgi:hypothetical protein
MDWALCFSMRVNGARLTQKSPQRSAGSIPKFEFAFRILQSAIFGDS